MNIKELNNKVYSEEFAGQLELLKKDNWDKLKKDKKLEFLANFQAVLASVDDRLPKKLKPIDFQEYGLFDQDFYLDSKVIYVDKRVLAKGYNPYDLLNILVFEDELFLLQITDFENINDDGKERQCFFNLFKSPFGEWDNYIMKGNKGYINQPVVYYALKDSDKFIYGLLKYMNETYGMDFYVGDCLTKLYSKQIKNDQWADNVQKNYEIMRNRIIDFKNNDNVLINNIFEKLPSYISSLGELDDSEFFSLLNKRILSCCETEQRMKINKEFVRRVLKGYDDVEKLNNSMDYVFDGEKGNLFFNGKKFSCAYYDEIAYLLKECYDVKIENDLMFEINDDELIKEAKESYKFFKGIKEDPNYREYSKIAYSFIESQNYIYEYYHNLIKNSIKNSSFVNKGEPCLYEAWTGKGEEYLLYAYDRNYDDVKKEQFESLKKQYLGMKVGGR